MAFVDVFDRSSTAKRTSQSYIRFSPDNRVILRMLNPNPRLVWKHWLQEANNGRGLMANCPNVTAQTRVCPIEQSLIGLAKDDPKVIERRAKKRYIINVLDRTPYTTCPSCNESTPKGKQCIACRADLKNNLEYAPLNRIKVLEGGPRLFEKDLNAAEKLNKEDYPDSEITDYDITLTTSGTGRERLISAHPQAPTALSEEVFLDPETGEAQKRYDLDLLAEPTPLAEIELMLNGGTIEQLNALRGIS